MVDPGAFAPFDFAQSYGRGLQLGQMRRQQQDKRRLADLLPQALGYGTQGITQADIARDGPLPTSYETADPGWRAAYDEARHNDPSIGSFNDFLQIQQKWRANPQPGMAASRQQEAMQQIAHIDPDVFLKLDERQKAQAKAELEDVSAAVRWADTPQKWAQVQQYYASHGHDVSMYPFEQREQSLLALGAMSEYLKAADKSSLPSSVQEYQYAKGQGFNGSYMDFKNQMGSPLVVDNGDGTKTIYPHGFGGGQPAPQQSGPQPGQIVNGYRFKGGNPNDQNAWEPVNGGPSPQGSGGFL